MKFGDLGVVKSSWLCVCVVCMWILGCCKVGFVDMNFGFVCFGVYNCEIMVFADLGLDKYGQVEAGE